jgi:N-methylhydantoinase B
MFEGFAFYFGSPAQSLEITFQVMVSCLGGTWARDPFCRRSVMGEKRIDPITLEILLHRLWQIADEAAIVLKRVSGSVVVIEAKDIIVALCDERGRVITSGVGVTLHCGIARYSIEYIIGKYAENPGIHDGDVFFINDPYICAMHQADGFVLTPVFYQKELVAWSITMTHLMDIGGADPGGITPSAREVFHEGFRFRGIKLAEDGMVRQDVIDSIVNMTRVPGLVELDLRAQLAAGTAVKQRLKELIEHYGVDTFKVVRDEAIMYSEIKLRARIAELPDGKWQSVVYLDDDSKTDKVYKIMVTLTKEGDSLTFDYTGTDEQAPSYVNVAGVGGEGGVFGAVAPLLAHDMPWSQGILNPLHIVIPEGTLISATFPAACSLGTLGGGALALYAAIGAISKMLNSADNYEELDVTALWGSVTGVAILAGVDQYGTPFVANFMDTEAAGGGATPSSDGIDSAGHVFIPSGSCPNVETYEVAFPILYLYRRQVTDSGGAGMFRGGVGGEWCVMLHDAPEGEAVANILGYGTEAGMNGGICGGYPGSGFQFLMIRDSDILGKFQQGDIPESIEEIEGNLEVLKLNELFTMKNGDVFSERWSGGGGYGDPIDRHPQRVRTDVVNKLVSVTSANEIYGVVMDIKTLEVDVKKTEQKRAEIRQRRLMAQKAPKKGP